MVFVHMQQKNALGTVRLTASVTAAYDAIHRFIWLPNRDFSSYNPR